jgi:peptidyl-prolyl cis-trans isomerase C
MMLKPSNIAAFALLAAIAANTVNAADTVAQQANLPLATVNGVAIPQTRLDSRVKAAEQQGQAVSPEQRKLLRDNLINFEVLAQQAAKDGLDQREEIAEQLLLARQKVLVQAYLQGYVKAHPISQEALKKEYEAYKQQMSKMKEYKLAHILVASEAEAQAIVASLKKKGKFEKLAKEKSNDPGSKNNGGDLGWMNPADVVPEFAQAVMGMTHGDISDPVKTRFGWHIIRLDDSRPLKVATFEELSAQIEGKLQNELVEAQVKKLRADATIQ